MLLLISFISHIRFSGSYDQSGLTELFSPEVKAVGAVGKFGAFFSMLFVYFGLGWSSFIFPLIFFFLLGTVYVLRAFSSRYRSLHALLAPTFFHSLLVGVWLSIFLALGSWSATPEGVVGHELFVILSLYIGRLGVVFFLLSFMLTYLIIVFRLFRPIVFLVKHFLKGIDAFFNMGSRSLKRFFIKFKNLVFASIRSTSEQTLEPEKPEKTPPVYDYDYEKTIEKYKDLDYGEASTPISPEKPQEEAHDPTENHEDTDGLFEVIVPKSEDETGAQEPKSDPKSVEEEEEEETSENEEPLSEQTDEISSIDVKQLFDDYDNDRIDHEEILRKLGAFDPKKNLSSYTFPTIDMLTDHKEEIHYDGDELEENRRKIVQVLQDYKVEIQKIKATVGPTVTRYEIIPQKGVRVAQVKKLEDDIALSLSALGIRIIAPIPGKGTIGIEVPNKIPSLVSLRSVVRSKEFSETKMSLPCVLGKTIDDKPYLIDIAKLPHLLMAGATGQGKSVGLNVLLASLLFKKHPAEIKFVMVDPKKVELSLFNLIERHFLAKLPGEEEPIITDTAKVVSTLKSLCMEMDQRYDLLKSALVRNINEYNEKFCNRKLNPDKGHKFMPYIVLVIDEFADLMMTAGKDVEMPIARLAQLSRAVGIHLVIATQRPSVNVITGIIKANFPARMAFRVVSKVDSRTILDGPGADQLIGRGDMLFTQGADVQRVQCAFVDTPEIERMARYIGSQRGFDTAFLLPEVDAEDAQGKEEKETNLKNLDAKFEEAAQIVVALQQGSVSVLQRKMNVGHGRAGRIIDQLELAQVVGPHKGSKARQVLIQDEEELEAVLENLKNG